MMVTRSVWLFCCGAATGVLLTCGSCTSLIGADSVVQLTNMSMRMPARSSSHDVWETGTSRVSTEVRPSGIRPRAEFGSSPWADAHKRIRLQTYQADETILLRFSVA